MKKLLCFLCAGIVCLAVGIAQADDWKDESGKGKSKEYKEWQKEIGKEQKRTGWKDEAMKENHISRVGAILA
jgi:hypothetical protein